MEQIHAGNVRRFWLAYGISPMRVFLLQATEKAEMCWKLVKSDGGLHSAKCKEWKPDDLRREGGGFAESTWWKSAYRWSRMRIWCGSSYLGMSAKYECCEAE